MDLAWRCLPRSPEMSGGTEFRLPAPGPATPVPVPEGRTRDHRGITPAGMVRAPKRTPNAAHRTPGTGAGAVRPKPAGAQAGASCRTGESGPAAGMGPMIRTRPGRTAQAPARACKALRIRRVNRKCMDVPFSRQSVWVGFCQVDRSCHRGRSHGLRDAFRMACVHAIGGMHTAGTGLRSALTLRARHAHTDASAMLLSCFGTPWRRAWRHFQAR
jgi:hypothetical protein